MGMTWHLTWARCTHQTPRSHSARNQNTRPDPWVRCRLHDHGPCHPPNLHRRCHRHQSQTYHHWHPWQLRWFLTPLQDPPWWSNDRRAWQLEAGGRSSGPVSSAGLGLLVTSLKTDSNGLQDDGLNYQPHCWCLECHGQLSWSNYVAVGAGRPCYLSLSRGWHLTYAMATVRALLRPSRHKNTRRLSCATRPSLAGLQWPNIRSWSQPGLGFPVASRECPHPPPSTLWPRILSLCRRETRIHRAATQSHTSQLNQQNTLTIKKNISPTNSPEVQKTFFF